MTRDSVSRPSGLRPEGAQGEARQSGPEGASPSLSWEDKGRQHYRNCLVNPEKAKPDYPTQDVHPPAAEAEFVRGFNAERLIHLGEQLAVKMDDD